MAVARSVKHEDQEDQGRFVGGCGCLKRFGVWDSFCGPDFMIGFTVHLKIFGQSPEKVKIFLLGKVKWIGICRIPNFLNQFA